MRPSIAGEHRQGGRPGGQQNKRRRTSLAQNGAGWAIGGISKEGILS